MRETVPAHSSADALPAHVAQVVIPPDADGNQIGQGAAQPGCRSFAPRLGIHIHLPLVFSMQLEMLVTHNIRRNQRAHIAC
jgi:hypothetical protein